MSDYLQDQQTTSRFPRVPLRSQRCEASVGSIGAILHDLTFAMPNGRKFSPMAEADWSGKIDLEMVPDISPHLTELGGEWPCVPFGTSANDPQHHGFCSNARWDLDATDGSTASFSITYPEGHDIASVRREIRLSDDVPAVTFVLEITPARDCLLPLGLHPIFRIPDSGPGGMDWTGGYDATTIPAGVASPDINLSPGVAVKKNQSIALLTGQDMAFPAELTEQRKALIQIWECEGQFDLRYGAEGASVRLNWNAGDFPHCLLWLANPGRHIPGLGRFTGLGVEPVSSLFDRGVIPFDPILVGRRAGVQLKAGRVWKTQYGISAYPHAAQA